MFVSGPLFLQNAALSSFFYWVVMARLFSVSRFLPVAMVIST